MKVFVTGGCGFIGSNFIRMLIREKDCTVVNLDRLSYSGNQASLADLASDPRYIFQQVDICDAVSLVEPFKVHQPSAVFHLAAESHVDRSIDEPLAFVHANVVGTANLLQVALEYWRGLGTAEQAEFRFLHVSTDEVYGMLGPDDPPFDEANPYRPRSPYAASKAASDHFARAWYHTYGMPVLVTNCSNNYGPYQFPEKLIPVVILRCLANAQIPVYGTGENVRDWLHVRDHCEALFLVWARGQVGETYNVGGGNELTNIDLVKQICELVGELSSGPADRHLGQIEFVEDRPGHDLRYAIDGSRIRDDLGWAPSVSHVIGLRETVEWYLANRAWWESLLQQGHRLERLGLLS